MRELRLKQSRSLRWGVALAALGLSFVFWPVTAPQAQRASSETPVNVTDVTTKTKGADAVVSISGDSTLTRAQTWQDDEGFHVVVYKGQSALRSALPRGVKARRVGDSLEVVVPVKQGGNVYVQPRFNQLDLVVGGGLQAGTETKSTQVRQAHATPVQPAVSERSEQSVRRERNASAQADSAVETRESGKRKQTGAQDVAPTSNVKAQASAPVDAQQSRAAANTSQHAQNMLPSSYQNGAQPTQSNQPAVVAPSDVAQLNTPPVQTAVQQPVAPVQVEATASADVSSGWTYWLMILGVCSIGGLSAFAFIYRRRRKAAREGWEDVEKVETSTALTKPAAKSLSKHEAKTEAIVAPSAVGLEPHPHGDRRSKDERRRNWGRRANDKLSGVQVVVTPAPTAADKQERRPHSFTHTPAVVFGAFRIDQEVEKLIQGQPHSIEVLAARAIDDRRAVETSLLKALQSNMLGEPERRRARMALEEYGFVARQSAALLLASDAYERTMAARVLGQVGAATSLPFLLEALHDPEPVVCTEAVSSLGALGLPSAIGALLDLARRHPELPAPLLGRALSACSVDCIDVGEVDAHGRLLNGSSFTGDIDGLEPVAQIEHLPEWLEDHTLIEALDRLGSTDVEVRNAAAQQLAQFQVQRSVDALAALAADDANSTVRATAVTSLGIIGHESVFAAVLISMADEAREVRAAAARALSRLSFDRADAYVRVIESGDAELLQRIARACGQAGLTRKALDRLASEDRRQAYEAFSLLSLVINAGELETILTVVEQSGEVGVRLAAARLLALQGQPNVTKRLRQLALGADVPEKLRNGILEAIYRDDHASVE
ncbi:MAG: HEAT repeat domain-containing protein [Pyrinomonadaceae bacterium]